MAVPMSTVPALPAPPPHRVFLPVAPPACLSCSSGIRAYSPQLWDVVALASHPVACPVLPSDPEVGQRRVGPRLRAAGPAGAHGRRHPLCAPLLRELGRQAQAAAGVRPGPRPRGWWRPACAEAGGVGTSDYIERFFASKLVEPPLIVPVTSGSPRPPCLPTGHVLLGRTLPPGSSQWPLAPRLLFSSF